MVAWKICGLSIGCWKSFLASMVKRTTAPGTTPEKPVMVFIGVLLVGGGDAVASSGTMLWMKSAVVWPVATLTPPSPVVLPSFCVTTSKLEYSATLVMPDTT